MVGTGGAGHGLFTGRFSFTAGSLFRNANGNYNTFSREVGQANKTLATQLQKLVVAALRDQLRRPGVSTGVLEKVTADPANQYATREGFGVGVIDYLESSPAKYWEQIERGSSVHVGQQLRGAWTFGISYVGADYKRGDPTSQRAPTGDLASFGSSTGEAFIPFGMKRAREMLRAQGSKTTRVRGVIRRPIEAEKYYLRGWETFDWKASVQREYDLVFRRAGYKVVWGDGGLAAVPLRGSAAAGRRAARGV